MFSKEPMKRPVRRSYLGLGIASLVLVLAVADAAADPNHEFTLSRPIQLGTSGSSIELLEGTICYAGTLGGLVEDSGGQAHILSNNHVLAQGNDLPLGTPVVQAALSDGGSGSCTPAGGDPAAMVASLSAFVPIEFCKPRGRIAKCNANTVDAAIAIVETCGSGPCVISTGDILDIGPLAPDTTAASLGMAVQKSGRTTGHTLGIVAAIDVDLYVCYAPLPADCDQAKYIALFVNQVRVDGGGFSSPGDSGSVIVECDGSEGCDPNPRAVGLLFAGGVNTTYFNPIDEVLTSLSVAMAGCGPSCIGGGGDDDDDGGGPPSGRGGGRFSLAGDQAVGLEIARDVRAQHAERLLRIEGVVGSGVSVDENGNPVIEVYVKKAQSRVDDPIPDELDGVPVRVIVTGVIHAY